MSTRYWCFTINNPTELIDTSEKLWKKNLSVLVYQKEIGENGTPHYQGYLELVTPRRLTWLKKVIPTAHLEPRKGSRGQALQYVIKEDSAVADSLQLFGISLPQVKKIIAKPKSKNQTQMLEIKSKLDSGSLEVDIADNYFNIWVRYYRAFERYRLLKATPRNFVTEVIVLQGPTGTGKSRWAMDNLPGAYWKQRGNWWDGYSNHEYVVIDEFYGWLPFDLLLRLCDRYPLQVETKGGQTNFCARKICITTNKEPPLWYKDVYFASFARRVTTWGIFPDWGPISFFDKYEDVASKFSCNLANIFK